MTLTRLNDENRELLALIDSQFYGIDKSVSRLIEGSSLVHELKSYICRNMSRDPDLQ